MNYNVHFMKALAVRGVPYEELALVVGVKSTTLRAYARGMSQPNAYVAMSISDHLNVDPFYLWFDEPSPSELDDAPRLAAIIRRMTIRKRKDETNVAAEAPKRATNSNVHLMKAIAARGVTYEELAYGTGVKLATLRTYARGVSQPNAHVAMSISKYLNVDPFYLWFDEPSPSELDDAPRLAAIIRRTTLRKRKDRTDAAAEDRDPS